MTTTRRDLFGACAALGALLTTRAEQSIAAENDSNVGDGVLRGFLNIPEGQVHYRYRHPRNAAATPLLMLHGFPSSAWILQPYVADLGKDRATYAFDLMGMGDSTGLPSSHSGIDDLAVAVLHGMDTLDIESCDLYGTLTGARVAIELALLAPKRVRKVILDEPGVQPPEEIAEFLERYMPSLAIDQDGSQFMRMFTFCRDAYIWFPWYRRQLNTQRNWVDLPSAEVLHLKTMEILKSMEHITGVFEASEKYPVVEKLGKLTHPTLVTDDGHPLVAGSELLELQRIEAVSAAVSEVVKHTQRFRKFLDA